MAGLEWEDWFEREEFIGQISDIRVQNLQVEREVVQKRTFTRWMNLHLEKCNPPIEVHDLFRDIRDGKILMALLEELSGCRLLHGFKPSSHRIFRLNNIAKVLTFLEERNVKLVSIDAADIADGNSSIVLGLIWNIILFFQIKELTGNIKNQFPSSSSLSSIPTSSDSDTSHSSTPSDDRRPSIAAKDHGKAIKTLLQWVQRRTRKYGVAVQDFGKSWTSGLAFLAVIKSIDPSLVDMRRALLRSSRENIEEAFRTAHYSLGIPRLLEPEDVTLNPPDEQSIMTYVSQFLEHFPGIEEDDPSDFLERSKVSTRMNEPPYRNGVQRKERFCVVKRDWVQPLPKIFISSVAEGREQARTPAQPRIVEDRPWDSEESSVDSSPSTTDSRPLCRPLSLNKDTSGAASSTTSSPQPSLIDSVMDSPDSWSEMPSELPQSCSDGSLSESATSSEQRYSSYPGELTSDQVSPLLLERVSQDQVDTELFVDEGNFSLSSVESLQAKSTLLSEEDDAYRYILDLKEDVSTDHMPSKDIISDPNAQQTQPCPLQNPEIVKPASHDTSCGDSDSGYYPGQKDISATQPDNVSKSELTNDTDEPVAGTENQFECKESLESSKTEAAQIITESDHMAFFEDDAECPVLQYERISISGSEEDVDLSEEVYHKEEMEENNVADVFSSNVKKQDGDTGEKEDAHHDEMTWPLHVDIDQKEPDLEPEDHNTEPNYKVDQACTSLELPQTSTHSSQSEARDSGADIHGDEGQQTGAKDSGMYGDLGVKDLTKDNPPTYGRLGEMNSIEVTEDEGDGTYKLESSPLNQVNEIWEVGEDIAYDEGPSQGDMSAPLEEELKGSTYLELEARVAESMKEDIAVDNESKMGGHLSEMENMNEEEASCTQNQSSGPKATEQLKFTECKDDVPASAIPCGDVPVTDMTSDEPNHDTTFHEQDRLSFTSLTTTSPASQPDLDDSWEHGMPKQPCDGQSGSQATWEGAERIMGSGELEERYPAKLRLSLSVMPLQPAPSQSALTDSEITTQEKVREGSVESPEQSPFEPWARHPGEWGVLETDLPVELGELVNGDEELADARENTVVLREDVASDSTEDESKLLTALCSQESFHPKELKRENGEDTDVITPGNVVERKMSSPATIPENTRQTALSDTYLLLVVWLLVYCIFVLPQMDLWTIPSLLLNLE